MLRAFSLPVRIGLLVAGTMLPLIGFSTAIVYQHYKQEQRDAFGRVLQFTRGIQLMLDREMQGVVSGLTVLASSEALTRGDFEGFKRRADSFLAQFPDKPSIVVGDVEGRQVFNSSIPIGMPLPPRTIRPERDAVLKTGKPAFSPLFIGSVSQRPIVTVTVPAMHDGKVLYDMSFDPPLEIFQRIIDQQKPDDNWTISIFDQSGVNFARIPNPAQTIGKPASPTLLAVLFSASEGQARTTSLEGVPLITAFSRSELTGWIAASGINEATLTAPALRTMLLTAAVGGLMLVIGLSFAIRMATRIARAETLHNLLIDELNHRVKNTLATVQSLSSQTFRSSADAEARNKFAARLASLGSTHDILSAQKWGSADIREVVDKVLEPYQGAAPRRIRIAGPELHLSARCVVMLSMALHELATNAAKYGALSTPDGRVFVAWEIEEKTGEKRVELRWREVGGPDVTVPTRHGFGSTLIEKGFPAQLGGHASIAYEPTGVSAMLEFPLK
jgi:two-component sensor histidine kinase